MKASELIAELERQIKIYGDLECISFDDCGEMEINVVGITNLYKQKVFFVAVAK